MTGRHVPTPPHSPTQSDDEAGGADGAYSSAVAPMLSLLLHVPPGESDTDGLMDLAHFANSLEEPAAVVP